MKKENSKDTRSGDENEMQVKLSFSAAGELEEMKITLHGRLADIPSLKNSKIPGKNFLNPDTIRRVKLLDAFFFQTVGHLAERICFGSEKVFLAVSFKKRKRAFDTDNAYSTIRDWLEPSSKMVGRGKRRGWGIGVIDNDAQCVGFAVKAEDIGADPDSTQIVLKLFEEEKNFPTYARVVFDG